MNIVFSMNWILASIQIKLDSLFEYAELIEKLIEKEFKKFNLKVEKEAAKLSDEQKDGLYDYYSDEHWNFSKGYSDILRTSLFIKCYSLLEYELDALCKHLCEKNNYSLILTDLNGKGIFRAKDYLKKVALINFPDSTNEWQEVTAYNKIRNIFVHNAGTFDNEESLNKLAYIFNTHTSIKSDKLLQIHLEKEFCFEVITVLKQFFDKLFKTIPVEFLKKNNLLDKIELN